MRLEIDWNQEDLERRIGDTDRKACKRKVGKRIQWFLCGKIKNEMR